MEAEITSRPVNLKMKQVRALSQAQEATLCLLLLSIKVFISGENAEILFVSLLSSVHVLDHSLARPLLSSNTTATICVGHHAVTLLRHSAYDGSRSVAADVAGPPAAINESCAAVGLLPQTSFKSNCVECEKHD